MTWRVEIKHRETVFNAFAEGVYKSILDLGVKNIKKAEVIQIFTLEGKLSREDADTISRKLLIDPITQDYCLLSLDGYTPPQKDPYCRAIEIAYNPGVMDPVEQSTIKGIKDLGFLGISSVRTAKLYLLFGDLSEKDAELIVNKVLANKLIQHRVTQASKEKPILDIARENESEVRKVGILEADDKALERLSKDGQLFLNLYEMRAIRNYFKGIKREPTDVELETIAQTWSEHCFHKTFRGDIEYLEKEKGKNKKKIIRSLLKSTIMKATKEIDKKWCVSVFHDNAGVIDFDGKDCVCFKVETHNHPSALEPFGGANTGIGGVIRDTLGTGLGAKPICSTDVFCFAPPDYPFEKLPPGTLHPKRVMKGVVSGVRDYGNKMGIPTVNGAILFDERYIGNPLVYCGNVGIIPKDKVFKETKKGDLIVAIGGKTGRDGIHGATFSSGELTSESEVVSSGAVQIGDPIQEKKVLDALLQARDENLYSAITDCGAGGFSSAVGEMGKDLGAKVFLDKAPLKYKGLRYDEIWISESQERMVLSVNPKNMKRLEEICEVENVEASVLGEFTGNKKLELYFNGKQVCDLDMGFLHEGNPKVVKKAVWTPPKIKEKKFAEPPDLTGSLLKSLSHYNVCSKEWVIRQYDHEVQGGSVIKPLSGADCSAPSDASVIAPKLGLKKGIAISNGINARFGMIDPFWMAASCIDEAIRQIIAVGGCLERIGILDNFCWGNPDKPDRLGGLVRSALGCYEASVGFKVPFISGKDSLYNEYTLGKESIAIPGTVLISAIGIIDDIKKCVTMDFKSAGNLIYIVGETFDEMGGSIYFDTLGELGKDVPTVNFKKASKIFNSLSSAVKKRLICSMHDCSEGGLGVALAEMSFGGGLGLKVDLGKAAYRGKKRQNQRILFSESNSRFVAEVAAKDKNNFEKELKGISFSLIGEVKDNDDFTVQGINKSICIQTKVRALKEAWQKTLRW
ncbi:MAG: phosphoribosylformylglycinamidine synthase subunit PurL [Candidatus Omnitrophica bacterium]|nr:phosphoribosylformylglycinamidine synthase subunit PurL [Candidatus Omnitrophota bacterium]